MSSEVLFIVHLSRRAGGSGFLRLSEMEEETPEPYYYETDTVATAVDFLFSPTAVIPALFLLSSPRRLGSASAVLSRVFTSWVSAPGLPGGHFRREGSSLDDPLDQSLADALALRAGITHAHTPYSKPRHDFAFDNRKACFEIVICYDGQ